MGSVQIITDIDDRNQRRRTRRVDADAFAIRAWEAAIERGRDTACCSHGGSVANKYGYPAVTDAVVAVALYQEGVVLVRAAELSANKVSAGGAAEAAWGTAARPAWDDRYGAEKGAIAFRAVYAEARALVPDAADRRSRRAGDVAREALDRHWRIAWATIGAAIADVERRIAERMAERQERVRDRMVPAAPSRAASDAPASSPVDHSSRFALLEVMDAISAAVVANDAPADKSGRFSLIEV